MFIICSSCDYQDWDHSDPTKVILCPSEEKLMEAIQYAMTDWTVSFEEIEVWRLGEKPCKVRLIVE